LTCRGFRGTASPAPSHRRRNPNGPELLRFMPLRNRPITARLALASLAALAASISGSARAQNAKNPFPKAPVVHAAGVDKADKNIVLTADLVTRDTVNHTVSATGHVEIVQGPNMLLAERVIWNQDTDVVTATGDVKLIDDTGDIYFGDYLEMTDDMREGFIRNVSALLSDNTRMVGRQANKNGDITTIDRGVYSPCVLCADDPTQPPVWQIKAVRVVHDTDEKRIYYHDATFQIDGLPVGWTPYLSTYDPSVKRADGFLETLPGYRSQLGFFVKSSYYFDIAPDIDAVLEGGEFNRQGPLVGGIYRERFDSGHIQLSGSITESDIRQYPTPFNQDEKTIRGHLFADGEFDLSDEWRTGFTLERSLDDIYVLKYGYSSQQILPTHVYAEGFYDRGYINASVWSFQDLRANIDESQPHALPYVSYSFFGDPGETLGGRWADSGSLLTIEQYPGQGVERIANNVSWSRKLLSDTGLVTDVNASAETDYYWTQDVQPDPVTDQTTANRAAGRFFPQAYAVLSYPLVRPLDYAQIIIEPIASFVVAPPRANNSAIPNEDSQDIELDAANMFSGNRFPGVDRIDDGSRVTYGGRAGLYNLGGGYTSLFLGQSYRITGDSVFFPAGSGLTTRFSDYVGQLEVFPGKLVDLDYRFELSNDLKEDRLQEINFRLGPDNYGVYGTYLFAREVNLPNYVAQERNEMTMATYYKFDPNWSVTASSTSELSHPRAVLRYSLAAGYNDDCSSFTVNVSHDQTLPVGGTSGTAVFIQFSLKNLGIFKTPSVH
jgi:LPS-assembly protein